MELFKKVHLLASILIISGLMAGCVAKKSVDTTVTEIATSEVPSDADPLDPEIGAAPDTDGDLTQTEQAVLNSRYGLLFDLKGHESKEVERYFNYFNHKARKTMVRWL